MWAPAEEGQSWRPWARASGAHDQMRALGLSRPMLDYLVSQLQRKQQILQICLQILVKETPNLSTERLLIWNPEPHRRKRKGSKNNCLFHSLLILPLSWHHSFPPRMCLVNHRRREIKLKYPRCSCSPIKPIACMLKKKKIKWKTVGKWGTQLKLSALLSHLWSFVYRRVSSPLVHTAELM